MKSRALAPWQALAIIGLLVRPAFAGDEDQDPPYMIYIDPQSGRYVTDDPNADTSAQSSNQARTPEDTKQTGRLVTGVSSFEFIGISASLLAVVAIVWRRRRRRFRAGHF
jgi:hypothetical protein